MGADLWVRLTDAPKLTDGQRLDGTPIFMSEAAIPQNRRVLSSVRVTSSKSAAVVF